MAVMITFTVVDRAVCGGAALITVSALKARVADARESLKLVLACSIDTGVGIALVSICIHRPELHQGLRVREDLPSLLNVTHLLHTLTLL